MRSRIPDEWFEVEHMSPYERIRTAAEFVKERLGEADTAIVLGSGLGAMTDCLENAVTMQSTEIPGYPVSTVPGHSGTWWKGSIQGKSTFMLQGRVHAYEGIPVQDVVMYVRILKCLGVKTLILTNAAGCANPEWNAGDIGHFRSYQSERAESSCRPQSGQFWAAVSGYDGSIQQKTACAGE